MAGAAPAQRSAPCVIRPHTATEHHARGGSTGSSSRLAEIGGDAIEREQARIVGLRDQPPGTLVQASDEVEEVDRIEIELLAQQEQHYPITKAIYTLLSTLGNGTELAAALGVWAMVFLSVAIMGAAVLGGKRGGLFKV